MRDSVEEALRESERKYRELVENANSIILRWTPEGRITFLNEFGQRFFGFTEVELKGRHVVGTIVLKKTTLAGISNHSSTNSARTRWPSSRISTKTGAATANSSGSPGRTRSSGMNGGRSRKS